MKKIISRLLAVIITMVLILTAIPFNAFAEEFEYGLFRYTVKKDDTVAITRYEGYQSGPVDEIIIPQSIDGKDVTEIKSFAIQGPGCETIVVPSTIVKIQPRAFSNINTKKFIVDEKNTVYKSVDGVIYSADGRKLHFFPSSKSSVYYEVLDTVEEIASWAFADCHSVNTIILPEGLKVIGSYSFSRCSSLNIINLHEGITAIGEGAFMGCNNMTDIYVPSSVTIMGEMIFDGCKAKIMAPKNSLALEYALENGYDVTEVVKPVSFNVTTYSDYYYEGTNGHEQPYTDDNGEQKTWFCYHLPGIYEINITFEDNSEVTYTQEEFEEEYGYYLPVISDQSYDNPWKKGEKNKIIFIFMGMVYEKEFNILGAPEIENFSIVPKENYSEYTENTNGEQAYYCTDSGECYNYWKYYISLDSFYYSFTYNGQSYTNLNYESLYNVFGEFDICFTDGTTQSYFNQWKVGYNSVSITLFNQTATTNIQVVKTPEIEELSIKPNEYYSQMFENTNGEWNFEYDEEGNELRYWRYSVYVDSFSYSFRYNGTYYKDVSFYDLQNIFSNLVCEIAPHSFQSYYNQWSVGDNYVTIKLFDKYATTTIKVLEQPQISNFSIKVRENKSSIYANTDGDWQYYIDESGKEDSYWHYYFSPDDILYSFTYNNEEYKDIARYEVYNLLNVWVDITPETSQNCFNQWHIGENAVTVNLFGNIATDYVEIKNSPQITDLTAKFDGESYVENSFGYWAIDEDGNRYWHYYIGIDNFLFSFTDENGTKWENVGSNEIHNMYGTLPVMLPVQTNKDNAFVVGDNLVTFDFFSNTATATFEIIKAPFVKFEVVPKNKLIFNYDGYKDADENGEYFVYNYDFSIRVEYADGGNLSFDNVSQFEDHFGTECTITDNQSSVTPWVIGKNEAVFNALGYTITVEVEVIESPIKSIKLVSDIKTNYFTIYEIPDLNGETIEIEYKDGKKIKHTISKDPCHYTDAFDDNAYYIGDYQLKYELLQDENGSTLQISYAGVYTEVAVNYNYPEIESATFVKLPQDDDYINSVIRITLTDGSTEDYTLNKGYRGAGGYGWGDENFSYIQKDWYYSTDKGLFYVWCVEATDSTTNERVSSDFYFLGFKVSSTEDYVAEFNRLQGLNDYVNSIAPNYLNIPGFNMEFNGEVTEDNIDYLIFSFVDLQVAVTSEDGMTAEYISTQLRERLNINGEIDLTLSRLYDAEKDLYQFCYYFDYYNSNNKMYMNVVELENGNYKYVYEFWFEHLGYYTIVAEINVDGVVEYISNAIEKGDVNADGEINILDLIKLKKISLEDENNRNIDFADVERNNTINGIDLAIVRKMIYNKF